MLRFLIPLLCLSSIVNSQEANFATKRSAATDSQIRFAIENKYDQTGPGAKGPEYAYDTYKTLDDALLSYLDDPDTKLPQHEREKAEAKLLGTQILSLNHVHKDGSIFVNAPFSDTNLYYNDYQARRPFHPYLKNVDLEKLKDPLRFHKLHVVKNSPLNLAHFTREPFVRQEFNPNPQYTFSYGVHDKLTGDSKAAHESRDGNIVRGYYSFLDSDGKQRTVMYTADDQVGFRAVVRRTATNGQ